MWFVKPALATIVVVIGTVGCLVPLYLGGYISRELVVAVSPDGSMEAVCRGWYPDQTEYELWLRPEGGWFGRRLGNVGSESIGRCGAVAWSNDGSLIAVSTQSGLLNVYEAHTMELQGTQWLHAVGEPGTVPTPRIVTALAFDSPSALRLTMCSRQPRPRPADTPYFACGPSVTTAAAALELARPRSRH
jgi:hypothetical protein